MKAKHTIRRRGKSLAVTFTHLTEGQLKKEIRKVCMDWKNFKMSGRVSRLIASDVFLNLFGRIQLKGE